MRPYLPVVVLFSCLSWGVMAASVPRSQPNASVPVPRPVRARLVNPKPASTGFEGAVDTARRESFPNIILVLDLSKVDNPAALRGRGDQNRLAVHSRLPSSSNGAVSFSAGRNVNLAGAFYLLPGDRIRGTLRYADGEWLLDSLERLPPPALPKVAQIRVELSTNDENFIQGEAVRLSLTVTNRGTAAAVFNYPSGQRYDFAVKEHGQEIWRWSKGRAFAQSLATITLGPGEAMTFRERWTGVDSQGRTVEPGRYTVVGWITATGQEALTESSAEVRVDAGEDDRSTGLSIEDLIANPKYYLNKEVTLVGVYRAQLAERGEPLVEGGPPTSRSDWILQDLSGSIYISGSGQATLAPDHDLNARLRVQGLLRMNPEGRIYVRALGVERLSVRQ